MNIPDPIMDPATIMVASLKPSAGLKVVWLSPDVSVIVQKSDNKDIRNPGA
jgi:hypothetical protein